jgi:hypothetical protein
MQLVAVTLFIDVRTSSLQPSLSPDVFQYKRRRDANRRRVIADLAQAEHAEGLYKNAQAIPVEE